MVFFDGALPPQVQHYTVPEGSDPAHLIAGTFFLPPGAPAMPLLPTARPLLLFRPEGGSVLCGPLHRLQQLESGRGVYGVYLCGGCSDWLWPHSAAALTDRSVPLDGLFPDCEALSRGLMRCTSLTEQNALFARFAAARDSAAYQSSPPVRRCLALIEAQRGQIRVAELAQTVGCSQRHLHRLLLQKVGLTPKTVCQLQQLHESLQAMHSAPHRSLLHLAVNCGYFDQAHMNRQFRQFLGCSAGALRTLHRQPEPPL